MFPVLKEYIPLTLLTEQELKEYAAKNNLDEEVLVEFLGKLASLVGGGLKRFDNWATGNKPVKPNPQLAFNKAKQDRVASIRDYAKAVRTGASRRPASSKMFFNKQNVARASSKLPNDPVAAAKAKKAKQMAIRQRLGLKNFLEAILKFGDKLNEGSLGAKRISRVVKSKEYHKPGKTELKGGKFITKSTLRKGINLGDRGESYKKAVKKGYRKHFTFQDLSNE